MSFKYQIGGSLVDSSTYIKRKADEDLYQGLIAGDFCYVLASRQTGKSSLRVRVMERLQKNGVKCISIDLDGIGSDNITPDQWYLGILTQIINDLSLLAVVDIEKFWRERQHLGFLDRLKDFVDKILSNYLTESIVVFIDEIDSTISLPFPRDDFFAWIRYCCNLRGNRHQYQQLTFCLLGVATPNDLIQNKTRTPFNIGTKIHLKRFTKEQLTTLVEPLSNQIDNLIEVRDEIHKWTGGQPFLTQKLCWLIAKFNIEIRSGAAAEKIGQLVHQEIINNWEFTDDPVHLATIRDRLLAKSELLSDKNEQAFTLLSIYQQVLEPRVGEKLLGYHKSSPEIMALLLTGLVVSEQGQLLPYNRIYQAVFNKTWVEQELANLRPYQDSFTQWLATDRDDAYLLVGNSFEEAEQWAARKILSQEDSDYLIASRKLDTQQVRVENALIVRQAQLKTDNERAKAKQIVRQAWQRANLLNAIGIGMLVAGAMYTSNLYQRFALCPLEKGKPGESIGSACFRNIRTSGEVSVFLSSSNFHLEQGTHAFKAGNYRKAIDLFEQAVDGDRTDPVPQIFLNNARARNRSQPPLKLAVVTSVDYYETAAKDVLRGVADAQDEFNQNQERRGSQYPFIEIEIANDENEPEAAKKVAQELVDDPSILGIMGHHSSESTKAAQEIYAKANIPVISPTSSSGELDNYKTQFFRAVGNTEKAAEQYFNYARKTLKSEKIFIFYKNKSAYSESLRKELEKVSQANKYLIPKENEIEVSADDFNIKIAIDKIADPHTKTALIILTNVQTNSVALATSYANYQLPPDRRLFLLGTMALSETETVEKGGKEIEGMILVVPCSNLNSRYMSKTTKHWNLPDLSWRTATSYDATQAFAKAIILAKEKTRSEILQQLQSPSFSLSNEETSGFGLKWDLSGDRSNHYRKYCVSTIKGGKFVDIPENPNSPAVK